MEEEGAQNPDMDRIFGYLQVSWEIENYSTATCKKNWVIYSPEFSVRYPHITKWRLFLKAKHKSDYYSVSTYLERLESDPSPDKIHVNWKICYSCSGSEQEKERSAAFERGCFIGTAINDVDIVESMALDNASDKFVVQCSMIVYNSDHSKIVEKSKTLGLKSLSQDLSVLYTLKTDWDTILNTSSKGRVFAHKAILCSRNIVLKTMIEKRPRNVILDEPYLDLRTTENIMGYLYTGDVKYVVRTPSFSIEKAIEYFDISELKSYYLKDDLSIRTKFNAEVFSFQWKINNTDVTDEGYISGPALKLPRHDIILKLRLYPNGIGNKKDYMSIFAELTSEIKPLDICIQFSVVDKHRQFRKRKGIRWCSEDGGKMGLDNFVSREILEDSFFQIKGKLNIYCKFRISIDSKSLSDVSSKMCVPVCLKKEENYYILSKNIGSLLTTGNYSDLTIHCGTSRIKVHKIILTCRSHALAKIINTSKNETYIDMSDVGAYFLFVVLRYLYSGIWKTHTFSNTLRIYEVAVRFAIFPLRKACGESLLDNIDNETVLKILIAADKYKDLKLKMSAFKFICHDAEAIQTEIYWETFKKENSSLHEELIEFVKLHGA